MFSAQFIPTSVISHTLNTWSVVATIFDSRGLYYAGDVKVGDIVYFAGDVVTRYRVTAVTLVVGSGLMCELLWVGPGELQAPSTMVQAYIGATADCKVQKLAKAFKQALLAIAAEDDLSRSLGMLDCGGPVTTYLASQTIDCGNPTTNYTTQQKIDAGGP